MSPTERCHHCYAPAARTEPFGGKPACVKCWELICYGPDEAEEAERIAALKASRLAEAARIAALPPITPEALARIAARRAARKFATPNNQPTK